LDFRTSGKYPYTRFLTLLFLAIFFAGIIVLTGINPAYLTLVLVAILPPLLLFAVSPMLTRHSVGPQGITLRQGWFFTAFIPAANIGEMALTDEEPPPRSISYSPRRRRFFLTMSSAPLLRLELKEAARLPFSSGEPVQTVVFSVDDPESLLADAKRTLQVNTREDRHCPHCRQALPATDAAAPAAAGRVARPQIEYIFLIHHDGRLVFQFAGGSMRPLSTMVVSGMLLVIQDFIRDAFKTESGVLRKLEHGDLTVIIEAGSLTYLAVVVSGPDVPAELRAVMKQVLKETEQEYGDRLRVWDGAMPEGIGKVVSQVLWA
jgi:hypothetical protein